MSMHPSLRRSAPRPSNTDPQSSPSPTIKEEQVEYKVHDPPPLLPLPSSSSSHSPPILYSRHRDQLPASITSTSTHAPSSSKLPNSSSSNIKSLSHNAHSAGHPNTHQSQSIRAVVQGQPDEFIKNIFPNENQSHLRDPLRRDVIVTSWWLHNLMEPSRDLCAFIPRMNDNQFHCTSCGKKFTRVDRAVDHFRVHIDHRPYQCSGEDGCGFANCKLGFFTKDCLKAHCARTEVTCDRCGTTVEDKNLARHQNTRKCRRV